MFSTDNNYLYVKDEPLRHPLCSTIYERLLTLNDKSERYTSNKVHEKVQVTDMFVSVNHYQVTLKSHKRQ